MLFSKETIGVVFIVGVVQRKFIIKNMQNITLGKNRLSGLFQYVNLATTKNIVENIKCRTHNIGLAIWRLKCFYETFVQGSTAGILLNFCAKNPPHRQAEKRSYRKKSAGQTAHLVFTDTKAGAEKPKRACFSPTLGQNRLVLDKSGV